MNACEAAFEPSLEHRKPQHTGLLLHAVSRSLRWLGIAAIIAGVAVAVYGTTRALKAPRLHVGPLRAKLAPVAKNGEVVRLLAIGDMGTGGYQQRMVARGMDGRCLGLNAALDGLLFAGDNIYQAGASSLDDPQIEEKLRAPYRLPCLEQIPIYAVLGNHDYRGKPEVQIALSEMDPLWRMPQRFYSRQWGDILTLVAFDSGFPDYCAGLGPEHCSVDFLLAELRRSETQWTIVLAHHPLASASAHGRNHRGGLMGELLRPMVCGKFDAWFNGHAHHMEHRRQADCPNSDLFIIGGGGARLYAVQPDSDSVYARSTHGFSEITATKDRLEVQLRDEYGQLLHHTTRKRSAGS